MHRFPVPTRSVHIRRRAGDGRSGCPRHHPRADWQRQVSHQFPRWQEDATAATADTLDDAVKLGWAMVELRALDMTLARLPHTGQYRVNFRDGTDATAATADTLDDAVKLGWAMVELRAL